MSASIVRLTESAFHEILQFVAVTSRMSERKPLVDSLRALASKVLNLDEMVIGRCGGEGNADRQDRCSNFDQMMSMSDVHHVSRATPCSSEKASGSACGGSVSSASVTDFQNNEPAGRVVVCHRGSVDNSSLCIVSSAKKRSHEELSALLKTLLPYVDDAFRRIGPVGAEPAPSTYDFAVPVSEGLLIPLTCREREVLHWTAQGKGCWETGHIVGISERTVKFHLQNIYRKLNVVNRAQAVARAAQINLLQ